MWLKLFGSAVVLVGIILIFDGERLIKKYFKDMKENDNAIMGMKFLGILAVIIGGLFVV